MSRFPSLFSILCGASLVCAAPALAQAQLVRATPAEGSSTQQLKQITLEFSEALNAQSSRFELVMTGMPGMEDHPPMKIQGFQISVSDKIMSATFPRALPVGSYELKWQAAGADAQVTEGTLRFNTK